MPTTTEQLSCQCPEGEHVTEIFGRAGPFIHSVGCACSGGSRSTEIGSLKEGAPFVRKCAGGFEGAIKQRNYNRISGARLQCAGQFATPALGQFLGGDDGMKYCPNQGVVTGVHAVSETAEGVARLRRLDMTCGPSPSTAGATPVERSGDEKDVHVVDLASYQPQFMARVSHAKAPLDNARDMERRKANFHLTEQAIEAQKPNEGPAAKHNKVAAAANIGNDAAVAFGLSAHAPLAAALGMGAWLLWTGR